MLLFVVVISVTFDATGQLDVLRLDGDSLGMDGAQVRVLENTDQECLTSLLWNNH